MNEDHSLPSYRGPGSLGQLHNPAGTNRVGSEFEGLTRKSDSTSPLLVSGGIRENVETGMKLNRSQKNVTDTIVSDI